MNAKILKTDECVATSNPLVEDFRIAARAFRSARHALERLDRSGAGVSRRDRPLLWACREEARTIYMQDVYQPTYIWYHDAFDAAYQASPDATVPIDQAYSR